ncbi:hypothetical protein ACIRQY_34995 [Streptomyces sp. NPDC101490]|uniref:hypothetical protein n=1 Tax=Streptomyces sp. NPDC101490 TaxID=3366143 RepID=UPI00381D8A67
MGDTSRPHLLAERWEGTEGHYSHLRVLYGAAALHRPELAPDAGIVAWWGGHAESLRRRHGEAAGV